MRVQYIGNKRNLTLSLPWMSCDVCFSLPGDVADIPDDEAEKLIADNPRAFQIFSGEFVVVTSDAEHADAQDEEQFIFSDKDDAEEIAPIEASPQTAETPPRRRGRPPRGGK